MLDHFDCIIRKEAIMAQQIKELIDRGFLNPHDVTEAEFEDGTDGDLNNIFHNREINILIMEVIKNG